MPKSTRTAPARGRPKGTRGPRPGSESEAHRQLVAEMRKKGYVTPEEAATIARVARPTVYGWVRRGRLTAHRVGLKHFFVSLAELRPLTPAGALAGQG